MPLWLAIYLIVGAIVGTIYALSVIYMAKTYEDRFRVNVFAISGGLMWGLLWPIALVLVALSMAVA